MNKFYRSIILLLILMVSIYNTIMVIRISQIQNDIQMQYAQLVADTIELDHVIEAHLNDHQYFQVSMDDATQKYILSGNMKDYIQSLNTAIIE